VEYFLKEKFDGRTIEELHFEEEIYCPRLNAKKDRSFTDMFLNKKSIDLRLENLKRMEFAFATLECKDKIDDKAILRKEIEGILITELMRKYRRISGAEIKLKNAGNYCSCVIGGVSRMPETDAEIFHEGLLDRIPKEVLEITSYTV